MLILVLLVIFELALTIVSPLLSLMLFVILAPFGIISDATGFDPRTYWAVILGLRALFDALVHPARVPFRVQWLWIAFAVFAGMVLWWRGAELEPAEFEKARFIFQYFVAGSLAAFAIAQLCSSISDCRRLVSALALSVTWVSVASLAEAFALWRAGELNRVKGPLGNANYLAAFLGVAVMVLLLAVRRGWLRKRYAYPVLTLAGLACLFTISRTGLMAMALGLFLHRTCHGKSRRPLRWKVVTGIVLLAVFTALAVYLPKIRPTITYSEAPSQYKLARISQTISDMSHLETILFSLTLISERPLLGSGLATIQARNYDRTGIYLTSHNTYLQILAGTGLIGAALLIFFFRRVALLIPREQRIFLLPVVGCLCVNAFFSDYLQSMEIYITLATAYVTVQLTTAQGDEI